MLLIEIIILCSLFFMIRFFETGTDKKNLKITVPNRMKLKKRKIVIPEYGGKFKDKGTFAIFMENFLLFLVLFFSKLQQ